MFTVGLDPVGSIQHAAAVKKGNKNQSIHKSIKRFRPFFHQLVTVILIKNENTEKLELKTPTDYDITKPFSVSRTCFQDS